MLVKKLVEIYLNSVKQKRKPATVRQYSTRLKPLVRLLGDREFRSLTALELEDYLAKAGRWPQGHAREGEQQSPDTLRANAIALQQLQAFAVEHKEIAEPILAKIHKPVGRLRERLPTEEETAEILKKADPAFLLIYRGLRQCGARPSELCGAKIEEINKASGCIELKHHKTEGKTGGCRRIAIGKKFGEIIREASAGRESGPIFLGPRGKPWTAANLSATYRRLRDRAGLAKDLCLYLARHEHASLLCSQKGINAAAEALGHRNIATTKRYVKTDPKELRDNQDLV